MSINRRNVSVTQETDVEADESQTEIKSTDFRSRVPWKTRLAFSVGHVLNDLCASMWFTYLLVFFHLVLEFDNTLSGIILLIGQVADGLATPFVGIQVGNSYSEAREASSLTSQVQPRDRGRCVNFFSKLGPRKSWHLFGTFCVLVSFPFIFLPCVGCSESSQWAQVLYFAGFVVIFQFGWAAVQVSHLSLIPVLAHDEHARTDLTAFRYAFTVASNITIYVMTWVILGISGAQDRVVGPEDANKFRDVVLIALGIGVLFSIIFHAGVDETKESQAYAAGSSKSDRHRVMKSIDWLKEAQFYQVGVLYMSTRLFVNLSQVYLPLWLQDSLSLGATSVATTPLALFVSGFLGSLVMSPLTKVVGRKVIYLIGALIGIGACLLVWFGSGDIFHSYGIYGVAALFGAGGSTMLITSLAFTADLIGPHVESGAFVYGAMSFTDKLSNGITVVIIQYLHPCQGCCPGCRDYYVIILALVCGGAAVLSLVALASLATQQIGIKRQTGYQPIPSNGDDSDADLLEPTDAAPEDDAEDAAPIPC